MYSIDNKKNDCSKCPDLLDSGIVYRRKQFTNKEIDSIEGLTEQEKTVLKKVLVK